MCSTDVYCSKQEAGGSSTKGNHHPSFLRLIGQKKTVDAAKICGGAENVVKTETANIRKMDCSVLLLSIYTPLEARVLIAHNVIA